MSFGGRPFGKATCNYFVERGKKWGGGKGGVGCAVLGKKKGWEEKKKKKSRRRKKVKGINNHWPVCIETSSDLLFCCVWGPWKDSSKRATASPKTKQTGEGGEIRTRHW